MTIFLLCVFAYMVGSISFGLLLTRAAGLGDIRAIGSGNIGATNVLRTGNKKLAAATLLLDAVKGTLVVLFVRHYAHGGVFLAALAVFLGHLYPVWLGFKGGKGVATGLGVFWGVCWPLGALCCALWLAVAATLRRSSLAALSAFAISPAAAWYFQSWKTALLALIIAALVFWKHRANIERLLAGTEPKIGQKA
ncbi:glycerol-3-phosphate acyltransferase [Acidocella aquatica]|uniref:Glycerol-3-phosphate acyltransferase n=1 Tax=Acidocella aquatica TaxID=1922313 RepID=A0ABQ6A1C0_9PROT|nr:glycerol-3-phosphate 1-O-acyltransferase PlsY [Acidocella aquatica]GLR66250.1 glycerol-3-phosphate acyltransferase [Acidocella aquatica]